MAVITSIDWTYGWQCLMFCSPEHLFNDCPKILDIDLVTQCVIFSGLLKACGSVPHVP